MKILAVGDVVSRAGCDYLREQLPKLKREYAADVTVVNGENAAVGNGITPVSARSIFESGADVITLGNHALRRPEIADYLEENPFIVRPYNYHRSAPGRGIAYLDKGCLTLAVINLQGAVYLDNIENPFEAADRALAEAEENGAKIILIDFHAEASSEKRAMGFYTDGRASVLFGTHTHVQTADEQIMPCGLGYITDLGMTGPYYSVLGVTPEKAIQRMKTNLPVRFTNPDGPCVLEGCFFEVDNRTGKTVKTERFRR